MVDTRTYGDLTAARSTDGGMWMVSRGGSPVGVVYDHFGDTFEAVPTWWPLPEGVGERPSVREAVRLLARHASPPAAPTTAREASRLARVLMGETGHSPRTRRAVVTEDGPDPANPRTWEVLRTRVGIGVRDGLEFAARLREFEVVAAVDLVQRHDAVITWAVPVVATWEEVSDHPGTLPRTLAEEISEALADEPCTPRECGHAAALYVVAVNQRLRGTGITFDGTDFRALDTPAYPHAVIHSALARIDVDVEVLALIPRVVMDPLLDLLGGA